MRVTKEENASMWSHTSSGGAPPTRLSVFVIVEEAPTRLSNYAVVERALPARLSLFAVASTILNWLYASK